MASTFRREYIALNGIRGIAAICVMLYHASQMIGHLTPRGYLAVDLFFVLSGFVIAHAYDDRLEAGMTVRSFLLIRLIRFWPLYAAGLGLGILVEIMLIATHNHYALPPLLLLLIAAAAVLFLPTPLGRRADNLFPINVPSWSLFFELMVNVTYAVFRPRLGRTTLIVLTAAAAVAFVMLTRSARIEHMGVRSTTFVAGCVRTILSFSIGTLIYRVRPTVPSVPTLSLLLIVALLLSCPWGGLPYELAFILFLSPTLVIFGIVAKPQRRVATLAQWLGAISFPLYAIHRPLLILADAAGHRLSLPPAFAGGLGVIISILIAHVAKHVDDKVRRRLALWLHAPARKDPAEAAAP